MDYHHAAEELLDTMRLVSKTDIMAHFNFYFHGELPVLIYLRHHEGKASAPSDISRHTQTSTARVATILNSLEKKGYVTRKIDNDDRRKILVAITEKGKNWTESAKDEITAHVVKALEDLGWEKTQQIVRGLQLFNEAVSRYEMEQKKAN